jgi:MFS family permease
MFRGLINDAKSAVSAVILRYVARASVAVPFIIAVGFGIAALTAFLVERYGAKWAYLMVAGGFLAIGIIAALVVTVKEHEEQVADAQAEQTDTASVASDVATQAAMQAPLAILGALFTTSGGAAGSLRAARVLGRNLPLVLLIVLIGALFWPSETSTEEVADADAPMPPPVRPNGAHHPSSTGEARL